MKEILPGVFTWPWFSERHGYDFNGYLFRHQDGNICVDPVEMDEAVLDELAREGVSAIVLTNRNHFRASAKVSARTGAQVLVHPADAAFVREKGVQVSGDLAEGQRVGPFTVVAAAGKSPGEVALHWPARRILVIGDACVGKPPGACALLSPQVIDDLPRLRRSISDLSGLDFDALLLGDGAPILTGGHAALSALTASF
jgi:glyoxylase-like metal-dependent hydrolase (beta-lactamase superfamily II)